MLNNLENLDVFMTCLIRLLSRFLKIYIHALHRAEPNAVIASSASSSRYF